MKLLQTRNECGRFTDSYSMEVSESEINYLINRLESLSIPGNDYLELAIGSDKLLKINKVSGNAGCDNCGIHDRSSGSSLCDECNDMDDDDDDYSDDDWDDDDDYLDDDWENDDDYVDEEEIHPFLKLRN